MLNRPKLNELFSGWFNDEAGIFAALDYYEHRIPWYETVSGLSLDRIYFGHRSGEKISSRFLMSYTEDGALTTTAKRALAGDILELFNVNWSRLWKTYIAEYEPLNSFDVTTSRELVKSDSETENSSGVSTRSDEVEHGKSTTVTHGKTVATDTDEYGFNSSTAVPSDKVSSEEGGTTVNADSGTDSTSGSSSDDRERYKVNSGNELENVRKYGNVGTVTPQRLITEERKVWIWQYFEQIFSDLDNLLAIKTYRCDYG